MFEKLMKNKRVKYTVSFEWPRRSPGWDEEALTEFERRCRMKRFEVHGCRQGWRAKSGKKQRKGLLITTNEPLLEEVLNEKCGHKADEHNDSGQRDKEE